MAESIEYRWVERNIPKEPCLMLNIGSRADKTVETFTKKGHSIVGIDILPDNREIENYEFRIGDLFDISFDEKFDCIYAISSIEHTGLNCYEQVHIDEDGDFKIVDKMFDLLNPGGIILITVPFGRFPKSKYWRVYDTNRLTDLIGGRDHSITFFLATFELFLIGFRESHKCDPTPEIISIIYDYMPIVQLCHADDVCSIACIKMHKPMED